MEKETMYALYGARVSVEQHDIDKGFESVLHPRELVALFTSFKKAMAYVKASRLKRPKRELFSADLPFRKSSLLHVYTYAEIDTYPVEEYEIDPAIAQ